MSYGPLETKHKVGKTKARFRTLPSQLLWNSSQQVHLCAMVCASNYAFVHLGTYMYHHTNSRRQCSRLVHSTVSAQRENAEARLKRLARQSQPSEGFRPKKWHSLGPACQSTGGDIVVHNVVGLQLLIRPIFCVNQAGWSFVAHWSLGFENMVKYENAFQPPDVPVLNPNNAQSFEVTDCIAKEQKNYESLMAPIAPPCGEPMLCTLWHSLG